jgi:hypothetical protein
MLGSGAGSAQSCAGRQLAIAGQLNLACVDTDRNGVLNAADCCLTGFADVQSSSGPVVADLCFIAKQGSSPTKIRGCQAEQFDGGSNVDVDEGGGFVQFANPTTGPFFVSLIGAAVAALPVDVAEAVAEDSDGGFALGSGRLVRDPEAALDVTLRNLMTVRFGITERCSANADFRCVGVPFPTLNGMLPLEPFDLCLPVDANGDAVVTFADDPSQRFVRLRFGAAAGAVAPAPALARLGLCIALAVLLAVGTVAMRRSRRFAAALPDI